MKKLHRNPEVNWRIEEHRENVAMEVLADPDRTDEDAGIDSMGTVTLVVGGVMHQLNLMAGEIWKMCDGTMDRGSMARRLAGLFEAGPEIIRQDLDGFLDDMLDKGLVHER